MGLPCELCDATVRAFTLGGPELTTLNIYLADPCSTMGVVEEHGIHQGPQAR